MTYVHVVHGWVWKWSQQVGGNAIWPCLGGSSGGDDLNNAHKISRMWNVFIKIFLGEHASCMVLLYRSWPPLS